MISADMKAAMKDRDMKKVQALRMVISACKYAAIEEGGELSDEAGVKVLSTEAKKRREAAEAFEGAGHADKAEGERYELSLIEGYLPEAIGEDVIEGVVKDVMDSLGDGANMGSVMGQTMGKLKGMDGIVDGNVVRSVVTRMLG